MTYTFLPTKNGESFFFREPQSEVGAVDAPITVEYAVPSLLIIVRQEGVIICREDSE